MNSKELYRRFLVEIQAVYELNEATVITDWVFEHFAGLKKTDLIKNPLQQIPAPVVKKILDKKEQLLLNQPVQYVVGETSFCGLPFQVNDKVLIPRPETEELTQHIINSWQFETKQVNVLDIGTGSGCIAVTIKKKLPSAKVMAVDASYEALEVAHKNAVANKTNVQINLFDFLDETRWPELMLFDIIVSNPPYIPLREKEKLDKNVADHEPHTALFVPDDNPLLFYEKIAKFGRSHLNYNGKIYLETHENYATEVVTLFKSQYKDVLVKKDMFGKERMVIASF
jgi:release factor glutamine methyltransferase